MSAGELEHEWAGALLVLLLSLASTSAGSEACCCLRPVRCSSTCPTCQRSLLVASSASLRDLHLDDHSGYLSDTSCRTHSCPSVQARPAS